MTRQNPGYPTDTDVDIKRTDARESARPPVLNNTSTDGQMLTKTAPTLTPAEKLGSRPLPAAYLSPYAKLLNIVVDRPLLSSLSLIDLA